MKKILASLMALPLLVGLARADDKPAAKEEPKPVAVKFDLVPSGHFIVKVKINGHGPYNLIFDTGAPSTLITPKVAREANLLDKAKDRPLIPIFGMMGQVKIKDFRVGEVEAEDVSAMILDHPTVKLFSKEYEKKYGSVEGIVGFPFFARFRMTVDYAAKELTFVPSGYKGGTDVMADLMQTVMNSMSSSKPQPRIAAPAGLWGLEVAKDTSDEADGVDVKAVLAGGPAAEAGLKTGDRILTIDGRWTDSVPDAYTAAGFAKPGKPVAVVVKRDGKEVKLTVSPKPGL
jgi:membrane-associated protease RseP (regulator of RpoE activity)